MRSTLRIVAPLALFGAALSCSGLDELKSDPFHATASVIDEAGRSSDPDLDEPLLAILELRIDGGTFAIQSVPVVAAIRALERRGTSTAVPLLEELIFDPVLDVQLNALIALETLGDERSLPVVAEAAHQLSRADAREQAYRTFTALSGTAVNFLDEEAMTRVLVARGYSVRSR